MYVLYVFLKMFMLLVVVHFYYASQKYWFMTDLEIKFLKNGRLSQIAC